MFAILQRWNRTVNKQVLNTKLGQFNPNSSSYPGGYYPRLLLRAGYPLNAGLTPTTTITPFGGKAFGGKTTGLKVTFPGRKITTGQTSISNGRVYQTRSVVGSGGGRPRR